MRSLPSELIAELAKECHFLRHLFELDLSSTYRCTDADLDVYYDGQWWYARGVEFDAARFSASPKVDSIRFEIDNVDKALSAIILSEEVRGKTCIIKRIALDKNMTVLGASTLFTGFIDSIEIDNRRAKIQAYNHFIRWKMLSPRRIHSATCQWTFKSIYCGYSGSETWCDHSWNRCSALGNTLNFGGFRWLPYLVDKQIWWGRVPK